MKSSYQENANTEKKKMKLTAFLVVVDDTLDFASSLA